MFPKSKKKARPLKRQATVGASTAPGKGNRAARAYGGLHRAGSLPSSPQLKAGHGSPSVRTPADWLADPMIDAALRGTDPYGATLEVSGDDTRLSPENRFATVTVTNIGHSTIDITSVVDIMGDEDEFLFHHSALPHQLDPGTSFGIDIEFYPRLGGERSVTLHIGTDVDDQHAQCTIYGSSDIIFFLSNWERYVMMETVQDNVHAAMLAFGFACERHINEVREASAQPNFLSILLDLAFGKLMPWLTSKGVDVAIEALVSKNRLGNVIGPFVVANKSDLVGRVTSDVKAKIVNKVMGLSSKNEEVDFLENLRSETSKGFKAIAASRFTMTDVELVAVAAAFDDSLVDEDVYSKHLEDVLKTFRRQVKSLGTVHSGPIGGYGMGARIETRCAWIQDGTERRLALGHMSFPLMGTPAFFKFVEWVAPEMEALAIAKEEQLSGGEIFVYESTRLYWPSSWKEDRDI